MSLTFMNCPIKIGTRGSKLALWQAEKVKSLLIGKFPEHTFEIKIIKTRGDHQQQTPLTAMGTSIFVKELETALLKGEIDLAVHSAKDLPSKLPDDFSLGAVLPRDGYRDLCITADGRDWHSLPDSATVGTGSPRRIAQLKRVRPDLKFLPIRGNVDTRLRKLKEGTYRAIILSEVSLLRLQIPYDQGQLIPEEVCLPAAGQGFIAVEFLKNRDEIAQLLSSINDQDSSLCLWLERGVLKELSAGCHIPVGVLSKINGNIISLRSRILSEDGSEMIEFWNKREKDQFEQLLQDHIIQLRHRGAGELINA